MLVQSSQLQVISMKYCQHFNQKVLEMIHLNCNPFFLSELYLDGCENVNDDLFMCSQLTKEEKALGSLFEAFKMGNKGDEIVELHNTSGIASSNLDTFDLNSLNFANLQSMSLENQFGINSDLISIPYSAANIDTA